MFFKSKSDTELSGYSPIHASSDTYIPMIELLSLLNIALRSLNIPSFHHAFYSVVLFSFSLTHSPVSIVTQIHIPQFWDNSLNYSRHPSRQHFLSWICSFGTATPSSHPGPCPSMRGCLGSLPTKLSSFSVISGMMVFQFLFLSFLFSLLSVPLSLMNQTACSCIKSKEVHSAMGNKMLHSIFYSRYFLTNMK